MKRKVIAGILIALGLAVMSVPLYFKITGSQKSDEMIERFEHMVEQETVTEHEEEKEDYGKEEAEAIGRLEDTATLTKEEVIGLIEIETLNIKYAVMEGTGNHELSCGIGHITDTAGIGEKGNCVLAGHRGSRHGTHFRHLDRLSAGDVIKLTDKEGNVYFYEVESKEVVGPYDNSAKDQGEKAELTLITCENKGTMRLIVKCGLKEEVE
ncbi:MAG: class D sortase [Acetatifactor sp.]